MHSNMASNLENSFKRIDNELWTDGGANNPGDYITQISWVLFLKYLEDLENRRKIDAELNNSKYTRSLRTSFAGTLAVPKPRMVKGCYLGTHWKRFARVRA